MVPAKRVILTSSVKYSLKRTKITMEQSRIMNFLGQKNILEIFNSGLVTDMILLEAEGQYWSIFIKTISYNMFSNNLY